jgi:O-acetyl-ADP-ribose deacetylase (regulator of RNase III)
VVEYVVEDIFASKADILVCPVNVAGAMGAGLAYDFKRRFAGLEGAYRTALREKWLEAHKPCLVPYFRRPDSEVECTICLFPTKQHWRDDSNLLMIANNLYTLDALAFGRSISIPKVGCGLGKLEWETVRPYIHRLGTTSRSLWRVHV